MVFCVSPKCFLLFGYFSEFSIFFSTTILRFPFYCWFPFSFSCLFPLLLLCCCVFLFDKSFFCCYFLAVACLLASFLILYCVRLHSLCCTCTCSISSIFYITFACLQLFACCAICACASRWWTSFYWWWLAFLLLFPCCSPFARFLSNSSSRCSSFCLKLVASRAPSTYPLLAPSSCSLAVLFVSVFPADTLTCIGGDSLSISWNDRSCPSL